ncbi:fucose-binding lectin II [Streptomyces noursei]|uniref:fucose-binding lectin II n=1 Tax=Streptomyces noursei TaxID=1971 RepID=UPI0023B78278|nr:fucose-binding lectin II [Streptomyces noursei]
MTTTAYVYAKGNTGEIRLPTGVAIAVKAKSNASTTQKVTIKGHDGEVNLEFTGDGERNHIFGQETITLKSEAPLAAVFEYAIDGVFTASKGTNAGGPYDIGNYHILVLVAENGDDADYNDTILEFSWHTK